MTEHKIEKQLDRLKFAGRILFLTEDTSLIRRQLEAPSGPADGATGQQGDEASQLEQELAARLLNNDLPLLSNISTDEITPGWVCFYYDETLGHYVYVGMREGAVRKDQEGQTSFLALFLPEDRWFIAESPTGMLEESLRKVKLWRDNQAILPSSVLRGAAVRPTSPRGR